MNDIVKIFGDARIAFRSDTLENWQKENPVLLSGEFSVVTDGTETERVKIGDGIHNWKGLPWWKGPEGKQGPQGEKGEQGVPGENGLNGTDGNDGTPATHSWNGTTLTITSASGTSSANLKGEKGADGKDGQDYILTETDKQEIADMVDVSDVDISRVAPSITSTISGGKFLTVNDVSPIAHKCSLILTSDRYESANIYEFNSDNMEVTNVDDVSCTFNENGTVIINGAIPKDTPANLLLYIYTKDLDLNKDYTVSVRNSDKILLSPTIVMARDENGNEEQYYPSGDSYQFTPTEAVDHYVVVYYFTGTATEDPFFNYFRNETIYPQLELGTKVTEWQEYGGISYIEDFSTVKVNVNGAEYIPNADGIVTDIESVSPTMEITTDNEHVNICDFTYCVDTKKYVDDNSGDNSALGDIETALDEIIEIQESLKDGYTGGTGGVSSWNDLTDKPFYDEGTKTATLDYANPPAVGVDLMGDVLYKVTDDILTEADINSANISLSGTIGGIDTNFSQELNVDTAMAAVSFPFGMVYQFGYEINGTEVVVMIGAVTQTGEFEEFGVTFNIFETGTYVDYSFMSGEGTINSISLEYAGELKTLDIKFIPDDLYTEIDQRIENYINEALGGDY